MTDPQPLAPTDADIDALDDLYQWTTTKGRRSFARAVLAKWGADHFADASKTMPLPAGYALVPAEPTPEMVDAAHEAYMPFGDMQLAIQLAIAAAPQAQAHSGEPVGYTHASWITAGQRGGGGHFAGRKTPGFDVPLYAAPQPVVREPLTLDEFRKAFHEYTGCIVGTNQGLLMAAKSATERAHGITGAKT